jgi:alpha-L-rhamnosidase
MWEHWNGIKEDGSFWSDDMNSFNHYAYGAVGDWLYTVSAGINAAEAGFKRIRLEPIPDKRLGFVRCSVDTVNGIIESGWRYDGESVIFEFEIPNQVSADVILPDGYTETVVGGKHTYRCYIN